MQMVECEHLHESNEWKAAKGKQFSPKQQIIVISI